MSFEEQLRTPQPTAFAPPRAGWWLLLLLLLCVAPRAMMAYRLSYLSSDGTFYIAKAQELEGKGKTAAVGQYDLNVYLLVMSYLHRAGLDWETAAKLWGVLTASLTVLPLFGWVRRWFNDHIALLAGVLYAAHPKLIEWAPEMMRESTFWFFFALSLYTLTRAIAEVRLRWFLAAGMSVFLAANTRFEGWFLLIPVAGWCGWRLLALREARLRLALGMVLIAACYPAVQALLAGGFGYQRIEWGSFHRLQLVANWLQSAGPEAEALDSNKAGDKARDAAPSETKRSKRKAARVSSGPLCHGKAERTPEDKPATTAWVIGDKLLRGFSPLFGLVWLAGVVGHPRLCVRRDILPLILWANVTLAAMCVHASFCHMSSTRYVLPLVMASTPFAAIGLLRVIGLTQRLVRWALPQRTALLRLAAPALLLLVVLVGVSDALTECFDGRTSKAELAQWIRQNYGADRRIVGPANWIMVGHYAEASYSAIPYPWNLPARSDWFRARLRKKNPDVIILCRSHFGAQCQQRLLGEAADNGFAPVAHDRLPPSCRNEVVVLARHGAAPVLVGRATGRAPGRTNPPLHR